ncbi:hypothetical protein AVT93_gp56 [Enterococcus phage vB_EfaS_IME196]|uniref:Uncharacterized protein n=1 Tax=Enterococcus phage vB_EfaS_IME196 TaxID=1747289 RepID=A0A0S2MY89_9CAUD|nr:hypothetical protein AVT93_gp56 [Enterococcus phage vB_EfaS_IME196]ALO80924.1 hypothetical protein [Enterococcus phage vB_EfaS_IME196]
MNKEVGNIIAIVLAIILALGLLALNIYILWVIVGVLFATGHNVIAWLVIVNIVFSVLFKATKRGDK